MTQFALAKAADKCDYLKSVKQVKDDFLEEVVNKLFPQSSPNEIYLLKVSDKDVDSLVLDAQKALVDGGLFKDTEFYKVIDEITASVDEFVFWYGSDYDELEYIYDVPTLLSRLEIAVSDSSCEAYVHYKKER